MTAAASGKPPKAPVPPAAVSASDAKKVILRALKSGGFEIAQHLCDRAEEREMNTMDVVSVLRSGSVVQSPDFEHGQWRYRVATPKMTVVVALTSANSIAVITCWRNR